LDGLSCGFYKVTRDIVGDDLHQEVFGEGNLFEFLNQDHIKLICKNVARDTLNAWRPITFLILLYTIIAKTLVLRIQSLATIIVKLEQTSFVQGRFILYTMIIFWVG
jgi:hypothetical protein